MSIEATIKTVLDGYAGLTALVSTRIYSMQLPQQPTYPNIMFSRTSTNPQNTLNGLNALNNVRMTFEVRGSTALAVRNVITQLKAAILTSTSFKSLYIDEFHIPYENEINIFRVDVDFSIWFNDV